ncbi:MAG: hypothetical protein CMJ48_07550 [Planctomycetaceae bacterium]|nr:hypothetical protein [Planctomycetaceae bacterium]
MDRKQASRSEPSESRVEFPLPRRVLRHLLFSHGITVGSRVLEVGGSLGSLLPCLVDLGVDAERLTFDPDDSADDEPNVHIVDRGAFEPPGPLSFDAVFIRDFDVYEQNLLTAEAAQVTANLMSCVRPGGFLVFLHRDSHGGTETESGHDASCFLQHLCPLPGESRVEYFKGRANRTSTGRWFGRSGDESDYSTIRQQLPEFAIPRCVLTERAQTTRFDERSCCAAHAGDGPSAQSARPAA